MKYYVRTQLSENISETPEGYLICIGVPIARTGIMEYAEGETPIEPGADGIVKIMRDEKEVFRPETIASFEGKPFTIKHPEDFVNPDNWSVLAKGTIQNVRRGEGESKDDLLADILITNSNAISLVKSGVRGLSCGYEADYIETGEGTGKQVKIIGNHVALVEEGRAGPGYEIRDSKGEFEMSKKLVEAMKKLVSTIDEATKKNAKSKDDKETPPSPGKPAVMDQDSYDELVEVCNAMAEKIKSIKPESKDDTEEKEEVKSDDAEGDYEARLSALEEMVKKLEEMVKKIVSAEEQEAEGMEGHEHLEDEEKMTDEEKEEKAMDDDEEEEKGSMVGDDAEVLARAEILCPGIQKSKDIKVKALKAAYGTTDGKKVIDSLTGGKSPSYKSEEQVELLFTGASELMKSKRSQSLARTKTGDFQSHMFPGDAVMTAEKLNEVNSKFYNGKK